MLWLHDKLLGNQYIGIEIYTLGTQEYTSSILVQKIKSELTILSQETVPFHGKIMFNWSKKSPVYVNINTDQVIQKEVEGIETNDKLLHKAFPNINLVEFYYEIWRFKSQSIVAICRKSYVVKLIETYKSQGVRVAGVALGISPVAEIFNFLETSSLFTNVQWLKIENETISLRSSQNQNYENYNVNGIAIQSRYISGFASVLRFFGNQTTASNLSENNTKLLNDFKQISFFSIASKAMLSSILLVLLTNFILFSHYYKKANLANEVLTQNQSMIQERKKALQRIESKQNKLKELKISNKLRITNLINNIVATIPSTISLTELSFNPLIEKVKPEKAINVTEKIIIVSGIILDNRAFTNWIDNIGKLNGVSNVTISSFGKNENNQTGFSIKIRLQ